MDTQSRRYAETAIAALDEVIAAGPQAAHEDVASAVRCVAALRNHMLAEVRNGAVSRPGLHRANALLSLANGASAPLIAFYPHLITHPTDAISALLASGRTASRLPPA